MKLADMVLRAIADDYENFERILLDVDIWAADAGITADSQTILNSLEELISDGYAQAYLLSSATEPVAYSADCIDDLWFYLTPRGKQLVDQLKDEWR